jgi:hypothetical protein
MAKGYETREFVMPEGIKLKGEEAIIRGALGGKVFKRDDFTAIKRTLVRGRPGYLKKGGEPYDEQEANMAFAACLKAGSIREVKLVDTSAV